MELKFLDFFRRGGSRRAVRPAQDDWDALNAMATLALQAGDHAKALHLYGRAISDVPGRAEPYYKRGNVFNALSRWEAALLDYDRAVELQPGHANAFCNRGVALERLGLWEEAVTSYGRTVALNPADFLAFYNRASVFSKLGRHQEALADYDQAIALNPEYAEAFINRGNVLQELLQDEAAVASYDRAIQLKPIYAEAFQGRGASFFNLGRFAAAIASFDQGIAINPDQKFVLGRRRFAKMMICDWTGLETDVQWLTAGLAAGKAVSAPFPVLSLLDSASIQLQAAQIWVRDQCPGDDRLGEIPRRGTDKKIRIGYFSADFRSHPVAQLAAEMFETHDRSQFEITAFAFGPAANDAVRARLERSFERFIDVSGNTDVEVASMAREFGIDIAVDLNGFTQHCRTRIFALRAAPVQIAYLGYPGTMGADYIDYLIADRTVVPEQERRHYSEKILYLPHCYLPHDSRRMVADTAFSREDLGLPRTGFVFCCFNGAYKITPLIFDSWMRILLKVPGSVLWLSRHEAETVGNLRQAAASRGVDPRRIIFADRMALAAEHLARHRAADLFLDTRPYNAHATALDALWAGLPVLTCLGHGFAGRVGASLLEAVALPELVTSTAEDYEDLACQLASNPRQLEKLRATLRQNRARAAFFDVALFTSNLERGFRHVHQRHLDGLLPEHVSWDL